VSFLYRGARVSERWDRVWPQVIVQRVLSARSLAHGKGATLFAGFLKILPVFTMYEECSTSDVVS
jgi:uncharacterized sodium:solute symporter family permease YidK